MKQDKLHQQVIDLLDDELIELVAEKKIVVTLEPTKDGTTKLTVSDWK